MKLGEDGSREWTCLEAAAYFEEQADLLGAQMNQARRRFDYESVKRTHEECFSGDYPVLGGKI